MIHVIATLRTQTGQRELVFAEFQRILPDIQKKSGCVLYTLGRPISSGMPGQVQCDPDDVVIIETWRDIESLKAHIGDQQYLDWYRVLWPRIHDASMKIFEIYSEEATLM